MLKTDNIIRNNCNFAAKFDLPKSTVRTVIKDKEQILESMKNTQDLNSTNVRKRCFIIAEMEIMLILWCDNQVGGNNSPIDGCGVKVS